MFIPLIQTTVWMRALSPLQFTVCSTAKVKRNYPSIGLKNGNSPVTLGKESASAYLPVGLGYAIGMLRQHPKLKGIPHDYRSWRQNSRREIH
jgi:hypothetical protein